MHTRNVLSAITGKILDYPACKPESIGGRILAGRLPGIGLDIGSKKIKIIQIAKRKDRWEIIKFGSLLTPPGTVESNLIVDPDRLGEEIRPLVKKLNLEGKRVVSAVGGQQIYIRNLIMPRLVPDEMRTAVYYQASGFLPIPLENAATDIVPLREFEDRSGNKTELFFLAVRRQQVENLEITCRIAGLKLVVVEIEPLSILRAWGKDVGSVIGLLSVGSTRSCFTVFNRGIPVFYRPVNAGNNKEQVNTEREMERTGVIYNRQSDDKLGEIIAEVRVAVEYYQLQIESDDDSIDRILLCGMFVPSLPEALARELNLTLEVINIIAGNILPRNISQKEKNELQYDFPLALGLAAREVI